MRIVTILGARPQFIKAAPVSKVIREKANSGEHLMEIIVHTGQHFDRNMSAIFFEEMDIPQPDYQLNIHNLNHGAMTGRMLNELENILVAEKPDLVIVYGDTNSTLAGALAAVKLHIPVAHVEAGLRSFNREMPEEHNRVLTDHCADILFCPTQTAVDNLAKEGIGTLGESSNDQKPSSPYTHWVGDTMYDAVLMFAEMASRCSQFPNTLGIEPKTYFLATIHRPYNTDNPESLTSIIDAFHELDGPVIFPVHPRTRPKLKQAGVSMDERVSKNIHFIDPVGYLDMLAMAKSAKAILTDSGGLQKEAYFLEVPCITLRPETEWLETVQSGWNVLAGASQVKIVQAVLNHAWPTLSPQVFGDGRAAEKIVGHLLQRSKTP